MVKKHYLVICAIFWVQPVLWPGNEAGARTYTTDFPVNETHF